MLSCIDLAESACPQLGHPHPTPTPTVQAHASAQETTVYPTSEWLHDELNCIWTLLITLVLSLACPTPASCAGTADMQMRHVKGGASDLHQSIRGRRLAGG